MRGSKRRTSSERFVRSPRSTGAASLTLVLRLDFVMGSDPITKASNENGPRLLGGRLSSCAGEDLNLHALAGTRPSTLRVYQFRHQRVLADGKRTRLVTALEEAISNPTCEHVFDVQS